MTLRSNLKDELSSVTSSDSDDEKPI